MVPLFIFALYWGLNACMLRAPLPYVSRVSSFLMPLLHGHPHTHPVSFCSPISSQSPVLVAHRRARRPCLCIFAVGRLITSFRLTRIAAGGSSFPLLVLLLPPSVLHRVARVIFIRDSSSISLKTLQLLSVILKMTTKVLPDLAYTYLSSWSPFPAHHRLCSSCMQTICSSLTMLFSLAPCRCTNYFFQLESFPFTPSPLHQAYSWFKFQWKYHTYRKPSLNPRGPGIMHLLCGHRTSKTCLWYRTASGVVLSCSR